MTGSRSWTDATAIHTVLDAIAGSARNMREPVTVVHGCAKGADLIADVWAGWRRAQGWPVWAERHLADWGKYGRRAGWVRNAHMVALGADICLAFIRDGSRGATSCADMAEAAGIRTQRYVVRTDAAVLPDTPGVR